MGRPKDFANETVMVDIWALESMRAMHLTLSTLTGPHWPHQLGRPLGLDCEMGLPHLLVSLVLNLIWNSLVPHGCHCCWGTVYLPIPHWWFKEGVLQSLQLCPISHNCGNGGVGLTTERSSFGGCWLWKDSFGLDLLIFVIIAL